MILEDIYNVIFKPKEAFKTLIDRNDLNIPLFVFFIAIIVFALNTSAQLSLSWGKAVAFSIMLFLLSAAICFILSITVTLMSNFMQGKSQIRQTVIIWTYAHIPLIFTAPVSALSNILGAPGDVIASIMNILIVGYVIYLILLGLSYINNFSLGKASFSLIGSMLLLFMCSLFIVLSSATLGFMMFI